MPNWCDTTYCCTGKRENLESLLDILDELGSVEGSRIPLYAIVDKLGGDSDSMGCRGVVESYRLDDKGLWLYQSTAWCEQSDFREFLEKTYPGMVIYYSEIEPMEDLYYTNDSSGNYISTRYIVDLDDLGWEYFDTIDEAADYISMNLGISPWDVPRDPEELEVWLEEANEYFSLHKIEIV
jgi:hypothetical protein